MTIRLRIRDWALWFAQMSLIVLPATTGTMYEYVLLMVLSALGYEIWLAGEEVRLPELAELAKEMEADTRWDHSGPIMALYRGARHVAWPLYYPAIAIAMHHEGYGIIEYRIARTLDRRRWTAGGE